MVDDPIEMDGEQSASYHAVMVANPDRDVFVIRGNTYLGYLHPDGAGRVFTNAIRFCIIRSPNILTKYHIPTSGIGIYSSPAEFLDFVKTNHPDHFEWLLFHPEWLS